MRYHCTCGKLTAVVKSGSHIRRGSVIVCRECLVQFQAAHDTAKKIMSEMREDTVIEDLLGKFGMGRGT